MTPEELDVRIARVSDLTGLDRIPCRSEIFPHLVARIRELEAQRPEVWLYQTVLGDWFVKYGDHPLYWDGDETKAREWATQNGFRVRA